MTGGLRLLTRIALFSALIYALSWGTAYLPNVKFTFFIIFAAGFIWGAGPGLLVGAIGTGLWTWFNAYGPAPLPIMLAQIIGSAGCGLIGAAFRHSSLLLRRGAVVTVFLALAALFCSLSFYLPVNLVDAWLFQPFWPRFVAGSIWMLISLVSNMIIFPLLFPAIRLLHAREEAAW